MFSQNAAVTTTDGKIWLHRTRGKARRTILYSHICPNCGRERWVKRYTALKTQLCQPCARTLPGRSRWFNTQ